MNAKHKEKMRTRKRIKKVILEDILLSRDPKVIEKRRIKGNGIVNKTNNEKDWLREPTLTSDDYFSDSDGNGDSFGN